MSITYQVPVVEEGKSSVMVTFIDSENKTYRKWVNVPRKIDGTVDIVAFTDILEAQLCGVAERVNMKTITFTTEPYTPLTTP